MLLFARDPIRENNADPGCSGIPGFPYTHNVASKIRQLKFCKGKMAPKGVFTVFLELYTSRDVFSNYQTCKSPKSTS